MLSTVIESKGIVKWRAMASTLSIDGDDDDAMYYNDRRPELPHPASLNLRFSCYLIFILSSDFPSKEKSESVDKKSQNLVYLGKPNENFPKEQLSFTLIHQN